MNGARAIRSEIVSTLKQNALSIFQIDDIGTDQFLHQESREGSQQLEHLRKGNEFLFASEHDLPDVVPIRRYLRSECIARVRPFFLSLCDCSVDGNFYEGTTDCTSWPKSDRRIEQTEEISIEGTEIRSVGVVLLHGVFHRNRRKYLQ